MVSNHPLISKSSSPFNNPLMTVPKAPTTVDIIVTFIFYSFFKSLARPRYLSFFSFSFNFILWLTGTAKSKISQVLLFFFFFFFVIIIRSGCLADIKWFVCISKSQGSLCVSFSRSDVELCIHRLFVWSNFSFLHNSHWITLATHSCLVSNSFCANLLHSLIMWLMVSSLSPYNLHLKFCCVLSILLLLIII